jgi:copper chaperone CopZ
MARHLIVAFGLAIFVGCGEKEKETTSATPIDTNAVTAVSFNTSGAPTIAFSVPDMMCPEGCGEKTKEILAEQPGAREVVVDFESKTVTVAIDDGKFNAEQAVAALVDHGFPHSELKGGVGEAAPQTPAAVQ